MLSILGAGALLAQSYTLPEAVAAALERYPATRAATEQASAAAAGVTLAKTSFLPRLDFLGQANRATHNNVFGMLMPQSTVAPISGPVLGTNGLGSVWGSALGLQVSWEPFDFGLRNANVAVAESGRKRAETAVDRTRLEVAIVSADAFVATLAAQQTAVAAGAGVRRSRVLVETAEALVKAQLRPGADLSRARAELAVSETQLVQAQQGVEVAKASLAQYAGGDAAKISVQPGRLLEMPPAEPPGRPAAEHPALLEQQAAVEQVQAAQRALDRSYFPRFNLQAASYARGTGALPDGRTLGGVSGLGPNIHNWGLGLTVTFPLLDLPALKSRREIENHRELAEEARRDQIRTDLAAALARARAQVEGARRIAQDTPIQLQAAQDAERQAAARYKAGLSTLVEVAEAQRLVTQAEIDDALARLNIWRALVRFAAAQGDLEPVLRQAGR